MFSLRTTWGTLSIILADAIISYATFLIVIPNLPGSPEWAVFTGVYAHLTYFLFTMLVIASLVPAGLYSFGEYTSSVDLFNEIIPVVSLALGSIATLGFLTKSFPLLNWRVLPPLVIIYILIFVFRYFLYYYIPLNKEHILIIGANEQAKEIIKDYNEKKFCGYVILGIVTSSESRVEKEFYGVRLLGHIDQIQEIVKKYGPDSILITLRERRGKLPVHELLEFKVHNIRVHEGPTFYEKVKRKIFIDEFLKPSWIIFEEGFFYGSLHGSIKRTQGIIVSFVLLTLFSPLLLLIALFIKLDSKGPVLFRQERVGLNGKIFRLLKFRSMYMDAEKSGEPVFAQKNDPRVTRVGRIIRVTRLDEMPQFINIFKGDMDLVGPRPERPFFVRQMQEQIPYYNLRHTKRPGLTGWAQINYRYGDSLEDAREKLKYDLYYIKHFSWRLDLLIIILTIKEVLFGKGR